MGCIGLLLTSTRVVFIQISISKVLIPKADSLHFMRGRFATFFLSFRKHAKGGNVACGDTVSVDVKSSPPPPLLYFGGAGVGEGGPILDNSRSCMTVPSAL